MALLERFQILLAHSPIARWATVDLPGAVHGQAGRRVLEDQPFHAVDIRLVLEEVVRIAFEHRLHIRLVALQDEGTSPDDALRFLQVAELLHHFWGNDPGAVRVCQHVDQPDEGLFQDELHRIAVHDLNAVDRLQRKTQWICRFRPEAVIGELHIVGHQFTAIEGWFVVPFDALAQMEDVGRVVWLLPPFGQMGLHREGARRHVRTDFIPHQRAVDEAQGGIGLEVEGEMVVEVRGIIATHAQDAAAPGLSGLRAPECRGAIAGARQTASRQPVMPALQESTTAHSLHCFRDVSVAQYIETLPFSAVRCTPH